MSIMPRPAAIRVLAFDDPVFSLSLIRERKIMDVKPYASGRF